MIEFIQLTSWHWLNCKDTNVNQGACWTRCNSKRIKHKMLYLETNKNPSTVATGPKILFVIFYYTLKYWKSCSIIFYLDNGWNPANVFNKSLSKIIISMPMSLKDVFRFQKGRIKRQIWENVNTVAYMLRYWVMLPIYCKEKYFKNQFQPVLFPKLQEAKLLQPDVDEETRPDSPHVPTVCR